MDPKGAQMEPKGAKMPPRGTQKHQKDAKVYPRVANWRPKVPQWSPKVTQSVKKTPQGCQSATKTPKCGPRCRKKQARIVPPADPFCQNTQTERYTDISTYILQDPWYFFQGSAAVLRTSILYIYIYMGLSD